MYTRVSKPYIGLKQGCPISPLLFNVYINDLEQYLDLFGSDPGVSVGTTTISSFMFADDVVILANSPDQLQQRITRLSAYCKCWGLSVNTEKTKVMIFDRNGFSNLHRHSAFLFENETLEVVDSYCYLYILLSSTGSFHMASQNLSEKAKKVSYILNRKFSGDKDINLLPKTQLYLFDIYVKPILLYGSEVWSTANYRNRAKNLNDPHTQNIVNDNFID